MSTSDFQKLRHWPFLKKKHLLTQKITHHFITNGPNKKSIKNFHFRAWGTPPWSEWKRPRDMRRKQQSRRLNRGWRDLSKAGWDPARWFAVRSTWGEDLKLFQWRILDEISLGGGSNIFYFHPYLGKIPILTTVIFFDGLKPPTSSVFSKNLPKTKIDSLKMMCHGKSNWPFSANLGGTTQLHPFSASLNPEGPSLSCFQISFSELPPPPIFFSSEPTRMTWSGFPT